MTCIEYPAHKTNYGVARDTRAIRWIVVHCTQGTTALSSAAWFAKDHKNPKLRASTHLIVDNSSCYRCVPDNFVAYGAQEANRIGLHLEFSGFVEYSKFQWQSKDYELGQGADHISDWCRLFNISPRRLDHKEMLDRVSTGIITHHDVTDVFHGGRGHVDPGPNFPLDELIAGVVLRLSR